MASRRNNNKLNMKKKSVPTPGKPTSVGLAHQYKTGVRPAANAVRHKGRERMLSVSADTSGSNLYRRQMNPGLTSTYSVGGLIARRFERWSVPAGAVNHIEYISSSPATARGRVIMFANYDSSDRDILTEDDFADRADAVSCSIWENKTLRLRGAEMVCPGGQKPVRTFDTVQDRLLTDGCTIHVGIFGADPGAAGSVYISYDYSLHVQRPFSDVLPLPLNRTSLVAGATAVVPNGSVDFTGFTRQFDGIGLAESDGRFTLTPGYYEVSYQIALNGSNTPEFFISVLLTLDAAGVPQSRTNVSATHGEDEDFDVVHPGVIVHAPQGGILAFRVEHDHGGQLRAVGSRSRALITRL